MTTRTVTVTLTESQARTICDDAPAGGCPDSAFKPIREALDALPPVMDEPTYPGAVVMTSSGMAVRTATAKTLCEGREWTFVDSDDACFYAWSDLRSPRPLTPAERREHGIPEPLPEGYVAVKRVDNHDADEWREYADLLDAHNAAVVVRAYADALEAAEAVTR